MFFNYNGIQLEITNREIAEESPNIWKWNSKLQITKLSWNAHRSHCRFRDLNWNTSSWLKATKTIANHLEQHSLISKDRLTHVQLLFKWNLLQFCLYSTWLNICYYHQDLHLQCFTQAHTLGFKLIPVASLPLENSI